MSTKELGNLGEDLACEYLVGKGYKILGRNWRISFGEIDIVARKQLKWIGKDDKTIHFVEVKTIINSEGFSPEQRVDYKKQQKLRNLASIWLENNKFPQDTPYQIDVIGVGVNIATRIAKIHYFGNVVGGI